MPLPLGPFLVAGATAAIGYFFQSHRAKIVKERDLREAELSQAQEICKEIMKSMDVLYYQLRRGAMPVAIRKAQDDPSREEQDLATWGGYEGALLSWMENKTRFAVQTRRYFGDENYRRLKEIQDAFEEAVEVLDSTYYKGKKGKHSVVKKDRVDSEKYDALVNPLEDKMFELSERMIGDIQNQQVGRLRTM